MVKMRVNFDGHNIGSELFECHVKNQFIIVPSFVL